MAKTKPHRLNGQLKEHVMIAEGDPKCTVSYFKNINNGAKNVTLNVKFNDKALWDNFLRRILGDFHSPSLVGQLRALCSRRRLEIAARAKRPKPFYLRFKLDRGWTTDDDLKAATQRKQALIDGATGQKLAWDHTRNFLGIDEELRKLEAKERSLPLGNTAEAIEAWQEFKAECLNIVTLYEYENACITAENRHVRIGETHKLFQDIRFKIGDYRPPIRTENAVDRKEIADQHLDELDQGTLPEQKSDCTKAFRYHVSAERLLGRALTAEELKALIDKLNSYAEEVGGNKLTSSTIKHSHALKSSMLANLWHYFKSNFTKSFLSFLVGTFIILAFALPPLANALHTGWLVSHFVALSHFSVYAATILMIGLSFAMLMAIIRALTPQPGGPKHTAPEDVDYFIGTRVGVESDNPLRFNPIRRLWRGLIGFFSWFHLHGLKNPTAMTVYGLIYSLGVADVYTAILPGPLHQANMWALKGLVNTHASATTTVIGAASVGFFWGKLSLLVHNTIEEVGNGWLNNVWRWLRRNYVDMAIILGLLVFGTTIELGIPFLVAHVGAWFWFNCITLNIKPGVMVLETLSNPRESIVGSTLLLVPTVGGLVAHGRFRQLLHNIWDISIDALFALVKLVPFRILLPLINVVYECIMQNVFKLLAWIGLTDAANAVARARILINRACIKVGYRADAALQRLRLACTPGNVFVTVASAYSALAISSSLLFLTSNGATIPLVPIQAITSHFHLTNQAVCATLLVIGFGLLAYNIIRACAPKVKLTEHRNQANAKAQVEKSAREVFKFNLARKYLPTTILWGTAVLTLVTYQFGGLQLIASGLAPMILMMASLIALTAACIAHVHGQTPELVIAKIAQKPLRATGTEGGAVASAEPKSGPLDATHQSPTHTQPG